MDIKDAREAAKQVARKEKQKEAIAKKAKASKSNTKKIKEFFKRSGGIKYKLSPNIAPM